jgi:hypothetical protein
MNFSSIDELLRPGGEPCSGRLLLRTIPYPWAKWRAYRKVRYVSSSVTARASRTINVTVIITTDGWKYLKVAQSLPVAAIRDIWPLTGSSCDWIDAPMQQKRVTPTNSGYRMMAAL